MNIQPLFIELTPTYNLLCAKTLYSNKEVCIDLFSHSPTWLVCLDKNSLPLLKKFQSLNKSHHHSCTFLIFSNPDTVKKKLGTGPDKSELHLIEKKNREEIFKVFKIFQLPWIMVLEEGKIIYSAHDFPSDFAEVKGYYEEVESTDKDEANKKITAYKEQVLLVKKKLKKLEKREIDLKAETIELKNTIRVVQGENFDLKSKLKELDWKLKESEAKQLQGLDLPPKKSRGDDDINLKKSFSSYRDPIKKIAHRHSNEIDIWKTPNDSLIEDKDLDEITGSRDLWINNIESKYFKAPNYKQPVKLFPIAKEGKMSNQYPSREILNKRTSPNSFGNFKKRYT